MTTYKFILANGTGGYVTGGFLDTNEIGQILIYDNDDPITQEIIAIFPNTTLVMMNNDIIFEKMTI